MKREKGKTLPVLPKFLEMLRSQEIYQQLFTLARREGVSLYLVGGVVRDLFFHQIATDLDFAISEKTLEFAAAYARLIKGSYVLLDAEEQTARVVYRRRITIDFTRMRGTCIKADLRERDFTINAMALSFAECMTSEAPRLIDPYGGREDLEREVIRMVSPHSIAADPLRMVRAYRFAAQFGFTLLSDTEAEITRRKESLERVSAERVHDELLKLFTTSRVAPTLERMARTGLLFRIFPELQSLEESELLEDTGKHLRGLERVLHQTAESCGAAARRIQQYLTEEPHRLPLLKLALLFRRVGSSAPGVVRESTALWEAAGERLRFSKVDSRFVQTLLAHHPSLQYLRTLEDQSLIRELYRLVKSAGTAVIGLLLLEMGNVCTQDQEGERENFVLFLQKSFHLLDTRIIPVLRRPRLLTGNDLRQVFGLQPGPYFRKILQEAETAEISGELRTKTEAVAWASARFGLAFSKERW